MNRIITQALDLLQSDAKIVGRLSEFYNRFQIYELSIIESPRGNGQWFQIQLNNHN